MSNHTTVSYRDIPEFPGYRVGDDGSVWTCRRKGGNDPGADRFTPSWRPMKLHAHGGYLRVNLIRDGKNYSRAVHCLVLEAFRGPCPAGMEACHFPDIDKSNNRLENLRWDTHSENMRDKFRDRYGKDCKACRKCGEVKPLADFYPDRRAVDGKHGMCKRCHTALALLTRDPEKKRKRNREWMRAYKARKRKEAERG